MSDQDAVVVDIYDYRFRLGSDSRDAEYIHRAAAYLDEKMRHAAASAGRRSPFDIAILAAMEIAEEVMAERAKNERLLNEADERISAFTDRLEGGTDSEPFAHGEEFGDSANESSGLPASDSSEPRF